MRAYQHLQFRHLPFVSLVQPNVHCARIIRYPTSHGNCENHLLSGRGRSYSVGHGARGLDVSSSKEASAALDASLLIDEASSRRFGSLSLFPVSIVPFLSAVSTAGI